MVGGAEARAVYGAGFVGVEVGERLSCRVPFMAPTFDRCDEWHPTEAVRMNKLIGVLVVIVFAANAVAQEKSAEGWVALFNGKDLSGWKQSDGKPNTSWKVVSGVKVDPSDE